MAVNRVVIAVHIYIYIYIYERAIGTQDANQPKTHLAATRALGVAGQADGCAGLLRLHGGRVVEEIAERGAGGDTRGCGCGD
jgi:hypothetical protein